MAFVIVPHPREAILEVVYPEEPTSHDVVEYLSAMRRAIDEQRASWKCLVDQRSVVLIKPALVEKLSVLNKYALGHGMVRSARIVGSSAAALQARRLAEQAGVAQVVKTFTDREEAWAWLVSAPTPASGTSRGGH